MDWCVDTRVTGSRSFAENEVFSHLKRHAAEPEVVDLARPIVDGAFDRVGDGIIWLTLDWSEQQSRLRMRRLGLDELPGAEVGPGVSVAVDEAHRLPDSAGPDIAVDLVVSRPAEADIDVAAAEVTDLDLDRPGSLTGLLAQRLSHGQPLRDAAAAVGAGLAARVAENLGESPSIEDVLRTFKDVEESLGGEVEITSSSTARIRTCPFGSAAPQEICRLTSALIGGLAARVSSPADVAIAECIAAGDHHCEVMVSTDGGDRRPTWHRYRWPHEEPSANKPDDDGSSSRGFHVTLSLELPRDRLSVPITRHLVRATMDEVGVVSDEADAVELAVSEACANVIDHSGPGDAYEVSVSIGPDACHIRVVDIGRGFDQSKVSKEMAGVEAEHGRGMALMHALVDHVRFESEPEKGTVVHLVKGLTYPDTATARRLLGGDSSAD